MEARLQLDTNQCAIPMGSIIRKDVVDLSNICYKVRSSTNIDFVSNKKMSKQGSGSKGYDF